MTYENFYKEKLDYYNEENKQINNNYTMKTTGLLKKNIPNKLYCNHSRNKCITKEIKREFHFDIGSIIFGIIALLLLIIMIPFLKNLIFYIILFKKGELYEGIPIIEFKGTLTSVNDVRKNKVKFKILLPEGKEHILEDTLLSNNKVDICNVLIYEEHPKIHKIVNI